MKKSIVLHAVTLLLMTSLMPNYVAAKEKYDSYKGLVMAGYQGWFNAEGDGENRGWYHYNGRNGFKPGSCSIDFWPDVTEYEKSYKTEFLLRDGSPAYAFSSYDPATVMTHFRWMKEYGIDGVFLQRFVTEINRPSGKSHFNTVMASAFEASKVYDRAVCVMYDLSGMPDDGVQVLLDDLKQLDDRYEFHKRKKVPGYLFHNGKPLVVVWGVGFNDGRKYGLAEAGRIVDGIMQMGFSVMLGVPMAWRTLSGDAVSDPGLHELVRKSDIIMPWLVGRYDMDSYPRYKEGAKLDVEWCRKEKVDYAPLCFPGFSWRNMHPDSTPTDRLGGKFYWAQLSGAIECGAQMLYLAMFDEIDEGTAIFKCANVKDLPVNPIPFQGIEDDLPTDHYLWLAGQAARMLRREIPLSLTMPVRKQIKKSLK